MPGAFAIEIEIADMKLSSRLGQLFLVGAVDRSSQTKLRIIRNPQRIVVVIRPNHR